TINNKKVVYYVVDIHLKDINCLQSVFAEDKFGIGYKETVLSMAERSNAILAINGDYYGLSKYSVVIRNGIVYRDNLDEYDILVLYYDGTMETYSPDDFDLEEAEAKEPYQVWTFGPSLLDSDGKALTKFSEYGRILYSNPRTSIGYYESGHYVIIVVDGRSDESSGLTMKELAKVYEELGCKVAYNLDGGKSSVMTFNGAVYNIPDNGGRKSSDAIIIKEVN
ncbi:MAG TPA: phosphodiester glycosidase family protein, partial [Bacilli bacterium]|nr:phosphodiester glycosidase family protein [Bacilli bacterium]